jgi:peptidoglycan/xylan/chitin deacetylase (PgdA/CDA1 family)
MVSGSKKLEDRFVVLKRLVKEVLAVVIRYGGIAFFVREIYARSKVSIVLYHDPRPEVMDKHLAYLLKRYTLIGLDRLVNAIYSKDWSGVPERSLVITLDDGFKGNFQLLEIFRKYRVVPTLYVCSQVVNTNRHFWFKVPGIDSDAVAEQLSNRERVDFLRQRYGFEHTKEYSDEERMALNLDEIAAMKGLVDLQSHTRFHPMLTACSDEECGDEIRESKQEVEKMTHKESKHFSYPNGVYTEREVELVRRAGYRSARTTDVGWNTMNTDPYKLKITGTSDDASINMLVAHMSGIIPYLRHLSKGSLNGKCPTIRPKNCDAVMPIFSRQN